MRRGAEQPLRFHSAPVRDSFTTAICFASSISMRGTPLALDQVAFSFSTLMSTCDLRRLCSYRSRRAGGRSSGVPSLYPFCLK